MSPAALQTREDAPFLRKIAGVTVGSTVERLYREIRPLRIYEGTSEIQKLIIGTHVLGK